MIEMPQAFCRKQKEKAGLGEGYRGIYPAGKRGVKAVFVRHDKQFGLSYRTSLCRFSRLPKHLKLFFYAIVPGNDVIMNKLS
jgi:hypothetical protein